MCEKSGTEERKTTSATGDKLAASPKGTFTTQRLQIRAQIKVPEVKKERHFNINCGEDTVNQATKCSKEASTEGGEQEEKGLAKKTHKKWTLKQWGNWGGGGVL